MFRIEYRDAIGMMHEKMNEQSDQQASVQNMKIYARESNPLHRKCKVNSINMKIVWNQFIMLRW